MGRHHYCSPGSCFCCDTRYSVCHVWYQKISVSVLTMKWRLYMRKRISSRYGTQWNCMFSVSHFQVLQCELRRWASVVCFPSLWYNSKCKPPLRSYPWPFSFDPTVMVHSQKCVTRSQCQPLQCLSLFRTHKILSMKLYRILTSARPPDPNCSCARILMECEGTVTVLYMRLQRVKKMLPVT